MWGCGGPCGGGRGGERRGEEGREEDDECDVGVVCTYLSPTLRRRAILRGVERERENSKTYHSKLAENILHNISNTKHPFVNTTHYKNLSHTPTGQES